MNRERFLNVSAFPAPEPLQKILESLRTLPEETYLRVLHRREPCLLFPKLESDGFAYACRPTSRSEEAGSAAENVGFEIFIWRVRDAVAARAVRERTGDAASSAEEQSSAGYRQGEAKRGADHSAG